MRMGLAICAVCLLTASADAQIRRFPYQATIAVAEAEVRSGPGSRYYTTTKLSRGAKVTVHRHDPGGWYMIAPPQGSQSLVAAAHVQQNSDGTGTVTANDVPVWVASQTEASSEVEQVRLSRNSRVTVLETRTVEREGRMVEMLVIAPPRGEFRWIAGQNVIPDGARERQQHDRDPFATPSTARREAATPEPSGFGETGVRTVSVASSSPSTSTPTRMTAPSAGPRIVADGVSRHGLRPEQVLAERQRLKEIDNAFRQMIQEEPAKWNFDEIESGYRKLQQTTQFGVLVSQIELRLSSLRYYQGIRKEYAEFVAATQTTSQRDAELAARQQQLADSGFATDAAQTIAGGADASSGLPVTEPFTGTPAMPVESGTAEPVLQVPGEEGVPALSVPTDAGPLLSFPALPETSSTTTDDSPADATAGGPQLVPGQPLQPVPDEITTSEEAGTTSPPAAPRVLPISGTTPATGNVVQPATPSVAQPAAAPVVQPSPAARTAPGTRYMPQYYGVRQPAGRVPARRPVPGTFPSASPQPVTPQAVPAGYAPAQPTTLPAVPGGAAPRPNAAVQGMTGAGIIQRASVPVPGGPQHVLLAPGGQILAWLLPRPGINLDRHIGQQMGVYGSRTFHPQLRADLIQVQNMTRVNLAR